MAGRYGRQGLLRTNVPLVETKGKSRISLTDEFDGSDEASSPINADYSKGGAVAHAHVISGKNPMPAVGTGCLACSRDDDHANLILCDRCNDEYHIYCLDPPLRSVPTGDWFCDKCTPLYDETEDDGLERLVNASPPSFTSRFGEIVWAAGGVGFGWWPACIYDPRLTVGNARELARKNLGKKHLVYFFECHEAPFSVLVNSRLTQWEVGIAEDYHLGRAARAAGKNRAQQFEHALQAAIVENGKPVELRLEWNHHPELPQAIPSPQKAKRKPRPRGLVPKERKKGRKEEAGVGKKDRRQKKIRLPATFVHVTPNRSNLKAALEASAVANHIESSEDGELYLKILKRQTPSKHALQTDFVESVGFVKLDSRLSATFADARVAIEEEIDSDALPQESQWKFYVPNLGPVSGKQETKVGPMLQFLRQTTSDPRLGDGSIRDPLKVVVVAVTSKARDSLDFTVTHASHS